MGLTEAERAGLSPQEIAAIEDTDTPGDLDEKVDEVEGLSDAELEDEKNDAEIARVAAEKKVADDLAAATAAAAATTTTETKPAAAAAETTTATDDADERLFTPSYRAEPVENYDEKLNALTKAFEDGEKTLPEYNREMAELVSAKTKADIADESKKQNAEQRWDWEIDRFMDDAKEQKELGNIDYRTNKILQSALDAAVKELAGKDENANKSGRWYLLEAHKQVMSNFGRTAAPELTAEEKAAQVAAAARDKAAGRRPDLKTVPKTLGGLPAAAAPETGTDTEFANLEKLQGLDLERAIARLSPEALDRYAQNG